MKKTKIVCTLGPAADTKEILRELILNGMNVARLNFSHGSHEDHLKVIKSLRKLSQEMRAPVAILQDLQGPKVRVGKFENGSIIVYISPIIAILIGSLNLSISILSSIFL